MIENSLFLTAIFVSAELVESKRVLVEMVITGLLTVVVVVSAILITVTILAVIIELVEAVLGFLEIVDAVIGFIELVEVVLGFIIEVYTVDITVKGLVLAVKVGVMLEVVEVVLADSIIVVVNFGPVPQSF